MEKKCVVKKVTGKFLYYGYDTTKKHYLFVDENNVVLDGVGPPPDTGFVWDFENLKWKEE